MGGVVLNAKKMARGHHTREFILTAVSDAAGKFSLDGASPGRWEVTAHVEDGRLWAFVPSYVDVPENQRPTDIMVFARPAFRLKGKYVASRPETMFWQEELILASISGSGIKGRNDGYRLEFPVCPDGTFDFVFETNRSGQFIFMGQAGYYARVKVPDALQFFTVHGEREHYLDFTGVPPGTYEGFEVALSRTSTLWGRLLDSRGQPLAQQEVLCPDGIVKMTDKQGRFTTEIPPLKEVQLRFRRPGEFGEFSFYLTPDLGDIKGGQIVEKTFVAETVTGS